MRIPFRTTAAAFVLSAALCLGACANAAPQEQVQNQTQEMAQTQEKGQDAASNSASAESQTIGLESVGNARQLGGYIGADGRAVRDGVLLRTASLAEASEADIERLKNTYHLAEVIDLRMSSEVASAPDPQIDGVKNLNLRIIDEEELAKRRAELSAEGTESTDANDKMGQLKLAFKLGIVGDQMYVNFLASKTGKEGYAKMFEELLALPEDKALLFHCTQGKDRTGCAAVLILSALGVDEDTIMADFQLTNVFNAERIEGERKKLTEAGMEGEELESYLCAMDQVDPQYMTNALDWIKENYGSVKGYLTEELGVSEDELAQLQKKFLI
ncbi:MAG: tyrosine-protein phosphatase [Atopobiaceae bacterium]|nr:tyrosine-protein phosphatase [Atopobiaceae bacterium]